MPDEPEPLQPVDRTFVRFRNRKLSSFSGCDYFRLSTHPAVLRATRDTLKVFGLTVSASRLTTGNHTLYQTLEQRLAEFFDAEDALLLPDGYLTTLAVAQALAGNFSHALIDERAHPALVDAAHLLECPVLRFRHRDADDFARSISRCGAGARLIALTDGMFSHDGSVAPLSAYLKLMPRDGLMLVDDAHGAGVLGRTGKGSLELDGADRERIVQCITLSKAFGAFGGAVLGSRALREAIVARSHMFIGTTPFPLPLAGSALAAIELLKTDKTLRVRLDENVARVRTGLRKAGLTLPETPGPIVSVQFADEGRMVLLKRRLLVAGIYPPFLNYPGGPAGGYYRFVISSEHSRRQLDQLIEVVGSPFS